MSRKVLIITQSVFSGNYGAILQAYALQQAIKSLGHSVTTDAMLSEGFLGQLKLHVKNIIKQSIHLLSEKEYSFDPVKRDRLIITSKLTPFIEKNIRTGSYMREKKTDRFDAFVVGSDQVWRKSYADIPTNLLDFVEHRENIARLSYAASFGKDDIHDYGPSLIARSAELAKKFDFLSVREKSGVDIVSNSWGLPAVKVVDPVLLLDRTTYENLIGHNGSDVPAAKLFVYVLDRSGSRSNIIHTVASMKGLEPYELMPKKYAPGADFKNHNDEYIIPPIEDWIRCFRDAEFIVTDSFHGCVLSILFNKPFIAIGNKERGLARFTSLLGTFGLEDRLVSSANDITDTLLGTSINWKKVNAAIKREQKRSYDYLKRYL